MGCCPSKSNQTVEIKPVEEAEQQDAASVTEKTTNGSRGYSDSDDEDDVPPKTKKIMRRKSSSGLDPNMVNAVVAYENVQVEGEDAVDEQHRLLGKLTHNSAQDHEDDDEEEKEDANIINPRREPINMIDRRRAALESDTEALLERDTVFRKGTSGTEQDTDTDTDTDVNQPPTREQRDPSEMPANAATAAARRGEYSVREADGLVGLLNQGATCYLNSLMQALYMTAPFRSKVAKFRFDAKIHGDKEFCIPYQLQVLFARLALSTRGAVSTSGLTTSFRWSKAELFRQHDVQELLRVLFEALEHTAGESNLLRSIYEGVVVDYVICQECLTKREKKELFLDLSLNVQGCATLKETMQRYVMEELLSGNDQYNCEKCAKKVDAKKGYRFQKLPAVLTLQLARFTFDYNTMGRVKDNREVLFESSMDLSHLMEDAKNSPTNSQNKYELFAVLMHSGTASGGHYFAYIKSFDGRWLEFNDANVFPLEDPVKAMQLAYGGSSARGTSAYMLLYKRHSTENKLTGEELYNGDDVMHELKDIVRQEDEAWRQERETYEKERRTVHLTIAFQGKSTVFAFDMDTSMADVTQRVRTSLAHNKVAIDCLRLRQYDAQVGWSKMSFENLGSRTLLECNFSKDGSLILETKNPDEDFPPYNPDLIPIKVIPVSGDNMSAALDALVTGLGGGAEATASSSASNAWVLMADWTKDATALKQTLPTHNDTVPLAGQRLVYVFESVPVELPEGKELRALGVRPGEVFLLEDRRQDALARDQDSHPTEFIQSTVLRFYEQQRCRLSISFNVPSATSAADVEYPSYNDTVSLSKRKTLAQLKEMISGVVKKPASEFRLRRSAGGQLLKNEEATLEASGLVDASIVHVELGSPLKDDEVLLKFHLYDPDKPPAKAFSPLFDRPVGASVKVSELKDAVLGWLGETFPPEQRDDNNSNHNGATVRPNTFEITHLRLRLKGRSQAGKILEDGKSVKASGLIDDKEIAVQRTPQHEVITVNHRPVFVQRWCRGSQKLMRKAEVLVGKNDTIQNLKSTLARLPSQVDTPIHEFAIAKGPTMCALKVAEARKLAFIPLEDDVVMKGPPLNVREGFLLVYTDLSEKPPQDVPKSPAEKANMESGAGAGGSARKSKLSRVAAPRVAVPRTRPQEIALKIHTQKVGVAVERPGDTAGAAYGRAAEVEAVMNKTDEPQD